MFKKKQKEEVVKSDAQVAVERLVQADIKNPPVIDLDKDPTALDNIKEVSNAVMRNSEIDAFNAKKRIWSEQRYGVKEIGYDDTNYSMDIPYKTVEAISDAVKNEPQIYNFSIKASKVKFSVMNEYKNHIVNKNNVGVCKADFTACSCGKNHSIKSKHTVVVPVYPESKTDNYDSWFAAALDVCIEVTFTCKEMKDEMMDSVKNMLVVIAKAVLTRSAESNMAKQIGIDLSSNNVMIDSLASAKLSQEEKVVTTYSSYTTVDIDVDRICSSLGSSINKRELKCDILR